ncbi:MAG TPA: hypothetical protein VGD15_10650, partial [Kribbella sp.]
MRGGHDYWRNLMDAVEIRVHGIGDHGALSALGSGALVPAGDDKSGVETYQLPEVPKHELRFVNWSRTSHRRAGFVWYAALPFTLVNVAGHMKPPEGRAPVARALHGVLTFVIGLVLSIALEGWLLVMAETALKYLPGNVEADAVVAVIGVGILLAITVGVRVRRHGIPLLVGVVHAACFLVVAGLVAVYRPAQRDHAGWPSSCSESLLGSTCASGSLDVMTGFVAASLALGLAAGALLTLTHVLRQTRSATPIGAGAVGAAALLIVALLMIHTVGWGLRYSLDWTLSYFTSGLFQPPQGLAVGQRLVLTATENEPVLIPVPGGYSAYVPPIGRISELTSTVGFALVVATLLVIAVAAARRTRTPQARSRERSARIVHDIITSLGDLLPWSLGLGIPLSTGLTMLTTPLQSAQATVVFLDMLAYGVAIVVVLLVCFRTIRSALGTMADVAGFWPVVWHPLAGSSYRDDVVAGIRSTLDREAPAVVALVGHSQGSVLCGWLAYHRAPATQPSIYLVTCGSPLQSLYATFFPAYFGAPFFDAMRRNVANWRNFWRRTDPIASELPGLDPECNVELADAATGPLHGHGDYWTEQQLTTHVAKQLAP